jgi:sugar lactone lactonase YvrE
MDIQKCQWRAIAALGAFNLIFLFISGPAYAVPKIYWADYLADKIQRANLDGSSVEDVVTGLEGPRHIDVDLVAGKIYWTHYWPPKIQRANLDGSSVENLITGLNYPCGIALDVAGGKMYWTDPGTEKIQRANLDGTYIEDLVTGVGAYDIALDLSGGKIYWAACFDYIIQRANLDGSAIETIVTAEGAIEGIDLDTASGKIYWTYSSLLGEGIQRANLDGSAIENLVISDGYGFGDIVLYLPKDKMYWTNYGATIQRANLDGSDVEDIISGLFGTHRLAIPTVPCIDNFEIEPVTNFYSSGKEGGPFTPASKIYTLHNTGPNSISWTASVTQDWLDVCPASGTLGPNDVNSVQICINANADVLDYGTYIDDLTITNLTSGMDWSRSVNLRVYGPTIELSQNEFYFEANQDGNNPADQVLGISNIGGGVLNWQVSETCSWLSADPNSGSSTSEVDDVNIIVDISGLAAGIYTCQLTVSSNRAENSPQIVTVQLAVRVPIIELSKNIFYFTIPENGDNQANQVLGISNGGIDVLNWQISETCDWLSVDPNSGSSTSEVDEVNIVVDINGLTHGIYTCEIFVSSDYAGNSPQIVTVELTILMPEFKLTATDGASGDTFGHAVDIDGDRCIVGADFSSDNGDASGSAYIFEWDGSNWIQQAKLTEPNAGVFYEFGCDVGINGDRCIVGAWHEKGMAYGSGYAYIFEWNGTHWIEKAQLRASDSQDADWFGRTVSLSGNRCIVGALDYQGDYDHSGAAYIFEFNGTDWVEQAKLTPSDGGQWRCFGISVDISGDRCIVGTWDNESIYIFEWNGNSWIQKAHLTGLGSDDFFDSVGIDGDRCIIGADLSQLAYIFEWNGSAWIEQAQLTASYPKPYNFGCSVSIKDNRCIVGAKGQYVNGVHQGAAYVFEWNGTSWNEICLIASDGASDDSFGYSVGISDNRYIVGSPHDDDNEENSGSVYVYQPYSLGDLDKNWIVDFYDFAIFSSQWLQEPGIPSADIAPAGGNGFVDYEDLDVFCQGWLD